MKRLTSIIIALGLTMTMQAQNRSNGYPITQVPFTAVKVTPNTFWGDRIHAAREVTIPLAFQKCARGAEDAQMGCVKIHGILV